MRARKVLLAGWDAADWKVIHPLLEAGKMPNVERLVRGGASGPIATLHPPLSPMLWTSIATGKRPFQHGIHGFAEPAPDGTGIRPVTNLSRTCKALWNILSQNDRRSVVVGWWPSHPAEPIHGVMVSDHFHRARGPLEAGWPLPAGTIHPAEWTGTLAALRMHPDRITPAMVRPFVPRAEEIDQDHDKRLALLLRTLAECMSIQAAALWLVDHEPWDFFAVYFDAIDHFCHGFMRYHPPRRSWIGERDFELYGNVVSMAYQFHDEMLGRLLEKAGEGVTVILTSDHGFHPDHLRPASIPDIPAGPAVEHRDFGVFAIGGPGIRKDAPLHGVSILDITPTILALYGLPIGEDMDGKVLAPAFAAPPAIAFIPSWESVPGPDGRHPPHSRLDPVAAHEALEQMIALGYIQRPDEDRATAIAMTIRDLRYNLGEACQDAGRHAEAREIFTGLYTADPDEQRFAVRLFLSCQALGLHEEMRRIVADLAGRRRVLFEEAQARIGEIRQAAAELGRDERRELARWRNLARYQPAVVHYLEAQILIVEERYAEALAALEELTEASLISPGFFPQIADLYWRLGRFREARKAYREALALDPDNVPSHLGLCRIALRRRQYGAAAHTALDAIERAHQDPLAHFLLGRALAGMKEYERAAQAFRAAISFNPNFPEAHSRLAGLLEKHLGQPESAREHRRLARAMRHAGGSLPTQPPPPEEAVAAPGFALPSADGEMPPLAESIIVVTGLPRSGTSLLMQMLAAGGLPVLQDDLRQPDEDNPRGYFEFEPVKDLPANAKWWSEARGKAIKIVAPLSAALPPDPPCRAILCERDLDEVLDSQERMLLRRNPAVRRIPERRRILKQEYARMVDRVKAALAARPATRLLIVRHSDAIYGPHATAERINRFLGGALDGRKMAAAVAPALHRNRATPRACGIPSGGIGEYAG